MAAADPWLCAVGIYLEAPGLGARNCHWFGRPFCHLGMAKQSAEDLPTLEVLGQMSRTVCYHLRYAHQHGMHIWMQLVSLRPGYDLLGHDFQEKNRNSVPARVMKYCITGCLHLA
jgi:hypothetical protein